MIHTIELQRQITKKAYTEIMSLASFNKTSINNEFYESTGFYHKGINSVSLFIPKDGYVNDRYYIRMVINIRTLWHHDDVANEKEFSELKNTPTPLNLLDEDTIFALYNKIYGLFPQLNMYEMTLDEISNITDPALKEKHYKLWKKYNYYSFLLNRIDYTYDIPIFPQTYLMLLNRGYDINHLNKEFYNHDYGEQNIYARNKSVHINLYDKMRQLYELKCTREIYEKNQNLRLEVSFVKPKLNSLKRNNSMIANRTLFDFSDINIAYEYFINYILKLAGAGDYVDFKSALNTIDNSDYGKNIKNKLKTHIREISKRRGIAPYLRFIKSTCSASQYKTVRKHLRMIQDLGINPVTLSDDVKDALCKEDGTKWLPSLLTVVDLQHNIEADSIPTPNNLIDFLFDH